MYTYIYIYIHIHDTYTHYIPCKEYKIAEGIRVVTLRGFIITVLIALLRTMIIFVMTVRIYNIYICKCVCCYNKGPQEIPSRLGRSGIETHQAQAVA